MILTDQVAAAVTAPASTSNKVINRNGILFLVDSSGNETPLGIGAGEKNYVNAPSSASGWAASGAGVTVATASTGLPRANTSKTGILITGVSGSTAYARYRFILDDADSAVNRKLKVQFALEPVSGYVASDFKVDVYSNTASDYTTGNARVSLSADSSAITAIPALTGVFTVYFDAPPTAAKWVELRIGLNGTNTHALTISDVVVGPGIQAQGAVVQASTSFTPTIAGCGTAASVGFQYNRVGETLNLTGVFTCGTVAGSAASFTLPNSWNANETRVVGRWNRVNSTGTTRKSGPLFATVATNTIQFGSDDYTTAASPLTALLGNSAFSNSDVVYVELRGLVITDIIGSGTLNIAQNDVEFAFNTDTSTTVDDLTKFGYGAGGALIQAITAVLTRRVRFPTPIQVGDDIVLKLSTDQVKWVAPGGLLGGSAVDAYRNDGTNNIGVGINQTVSLPATDIDVKFGTYRTGTTTAWGATVGGYYWRLEKHKAGQAVGFGKATDGSLGLVNTYVDYTTSSTFTFNGGGGTTGAITLRAQRLGDFVTLHIPAFNGTSGTASTTLTANTALPTWARPQANTQSALLGDIRNNALDLATPGLAIINTSGILTILRDSATTAWTNSSSCGLNDPNTITYFVGTGS